jgi:hypothetical protein
VDPILVRCPDTGDRQVLPPKLDIFGQQARPVSWLLGLLRASLPQKAAKNVGQPLVCRSTASKHAREVNVFKVQRGVGSGALVAAAMGLSAGRFAVLRRLRCHGSCCIHQVLWKEMGNDGGSTNLRDLLPLIPRILSSAVCG